MYFFISAGKNSPPPGARPLKKISLKPNFKDYIKAVLANAKILSETLKNNGFKIFSGGTDTHLMLIDLRSFKVTGKDAQASLGKANITCNKNGIPFDTESPFITSGIRLGTPACTTRGFKEKEFKLIIEKKDRQLAGFSVPAHALFLKNIDYDWDKILLNG